MEIEIKYNNEVLANVDDGKVATILCDGKRMEGDLVITVPKSLDGTPAVVDSLDRILVTDKNNGRVYKCKDKLYQVSKITSLKGLTIKFNKSIVPCLISEDEEFECSGIFYDGSRSVYTNTNEINITSVKRDVYGTPCFIAFNVHGNDAYEGEVYPCYYADVFYDGFWQLIDGNGNQCETSSISIANFDCPSLNEDSYFINWVLANAKVYAKVENVKDIQSFAFSKSMTASDIMYLVDELNGAVQFVFNSWAYNHSFAGEHVVSFSVNGERVTKVFSNFAVYGEDFYNGVFGRVVEFSDSDTGEMLTLEVPENDGNWDVTPVIMKYNDTILDGGVTVTKLDLGMLNNSYYIIRYILCNTVVNDLGVSIKELITPEGTLSVTGNGEVDVKNYVKADVSVKSTADDGLLEEKELELLELLRGEY